MSNSNRMDIDARDDDETHLFGEVNVAKANTKLWLVKVPNFVAEEWLKSPAGIELGKVKIHRREGANQADVSLAIKTNATIPKEYDMAPITSPVPMEIFSETKDGLLAMEGLVQYRFEMKSNINAPEYRQVMAQRRNVAEKKGRPVVIVAERDSLSSASKSFTNTLVKRRQVVDERGVADKRERLEKTKLLELIFKAFRKQDYWTLKDLNNHCNQPVNYLKEVLNEVCSYNTSGKHKSTYELKPEYRTAPKKPEPEEDKSATIPPPS
jgi:transcription initiation factor TFIIF subunit beta